MWRALRFAPWAGLPLSLLLTALAWYGAEATHGVAHLEDYACEACHLARDGVTQDNAHQLVDSQERLCGGCHDGAVKVSHPSGITVNRPLPKDFPLDWKNDLTCSTCHQIHGRDASLMRVDASGPQLCGQCHDAQFFASMRDGGESLMVSGHIDARTGDIDPSVDLDRFSLQCLDCHQGQFTSDKFRISRTILRHGDNRMNHPIGSTYAYYEGYGGYRKVANLKKEILLPNGRVACVSCHRGYSDEHGELVSDRKRLCYECHDL